MIKLVFTGTLVSNPATRFIDAGKRQTICGFTVKTDSDTYFLVTCRGRQAENAAKYLRKGRRVCVEAGTIITRAYTGRDGKARYTMEVSAEVIDYG